MLLVFPSGILEALVLGWLSLLNDPFKWPDTCRTGVITSNYHWLGPTLQDLRGSCPLAWGGFRGLKWWVFHCVIFKAEPASVTGTFHNLSCTVLVLVAGHVTHACHNNRPSQPLSFPKWCFLFWMVLNLPQKVKDINKKYPGPLYI